ncbi:hypothetical protein FSARC_2973 [Fusarium sarcochroum]|uniref:Uncharacterized protein n=1 Tax=Fusarium sarcochroum TaxID=1208366 RepID=A0A8H4U5I8_9HYPO|nr:hypothetical protein FSARC_2973 [Fusarium sarcochroum]
MCLFPFLTRCCSGKKGTKKKDPGTIPPLPRSGPKSNFLKKKSHKYKLVEKNFKDDWKLPEKTATAQSIYMVEEKHLAGSYRGRRFKR